MLANNKLSVNYAIPALLLVTFAVFAFFYQETWLYLFDKWNQYEEGDYGHGYLVVLISLYIIYDQRRRFDSLPIQPSVMGLSIVAVVSFLWGVSVVADVMLVQAVCLVFLILGVVWAGLGTDYVKILAFPVLYLLFAIPAWSLLSPVLQGLTADAVYPLVRLLEIPATRNQYLITLPFGSLSIEEACSGLRYLLAALTLSVLYAYLNYSQLYARIWVVVIAAVAAIFTNVIRVLILVNLAYTSEMQHPMIADHLMLGWILFGVVMFLLLAFDVLLHRFKQRKAMKANLTCEIVNIPPVEKTQIITYGKYSFLGFLTAMLLLLIGPMLAYQYHSTKELSVANTVNRTVLITPDQGWEQEATLTESTWKPHYNGAIETVADFRKQAHSVRLYLGYYAHQGQGKELINSLNRISGNHEWYQISSSPASVISYNDQYYLEQRIQNSNGQKLLVWYRYEIGGNITIDRYKAKLLQVWGAFSGNPSAEVVALGVRITSDEIAARAILGDFSTSVSWRTSLTH